MAKRSISGARHLAAFFLVSTGPKASAAAIVLASLVLAAGFNHYFFVFAVSALLSSLAAPKGTELKRSLFLSSLPLVCAAVLSLFLPAARLPFLMALVLSVRYACVRAFSGAGFFRSLVPASAQSLLIFAWFLLVPSFDTYGGLLLFFVLSAAGIALIEACGWFAGTPLRGVFGEGLFTVSHLVLTNVFKGSNKIEAIFSKNAVRTKAMVSVVGLRSGRGLKALIVAPFVHPGPFGVIGSSGMPQQVCSGLSKRFGAEVFFAKGGGTHDDNLASSGEIPKVLKKAGSLVGSIKFSRKCTAFARAGSAAGFRFGSSVLGLSTKGDDVELDAGYGFIGAMRAHAKSAVYIEAHSSFSGGSPVGAGSRQYSDMRGSLATVSKRLSEAGTHPFRAGVARVFPRLSAREGMGEGGVGVVLFDSGGKRFALVFVDSNNVAKGVRENILEAFRRRGLSGAEVVSSDSHRISTLLEGENPLCANGGASLLVDSCVECLELAEKEMEDCSIGAASGFVGVSVFGRGASARVFDAVNSAAVRAGASILFMAAVSILAGMAI